MKKLRGIIIAMMLGIVTLMLSGCNAGSSVDTALTINNDISGTRVMDIAIVDSVFNDNFNGTPEDLYALVEAKCPQELSWSYEETEEAKKYTFTLTFSGLEDYQQKVDALCGEEKEITINVADSIWSNGVFVQENFNSKDLLKWLSDALVEVEYVSESNSGKIFADGSTSVNFGNESNDCYANIYWDNITYLKLNSITVKADIATIDAYRMRVDIDVPAESMNAKGDEIRDFINKCVPALGKMEEEENENGVIFSIIKEPVDVAGMENFMVTVFGEGNANATQNLEGVDATHPFVFKNVIEQTISLRNYMAGNNASARFRYLIKSPEDIDVQLNNSDYGYSEEDGFMVMKDQYVSNDEMELKLSMTKTYRFNEMTVKTTQKGTDKWEKVSTFQYASVPNEEDMAETVARFERKISGEETQATAESTEDTAAAGDAADTNEETTESKTEEKKDQKSSLDVKVKSDTKDGYSITVTQKGTSQEIAESSKLLFGRANAVVYASEGGFARVSKKQAVVDELNYNYLLENQVPSDFVMHYTLKIKGLGQITDTNVAESNLTEQKGNSITADFNKAAMSVEVYGTYTDVLALLFWGLMVVGIALILLGVLKSGVIKGKKAPVKTEVPAQSAAVVSAPAENTVASAENTTAATESAVTTEATAPATEESTTPETSEAQAVAFCENCGAKLEPGAAFCEQCGTKIS